MNVTPPNKLVVYLAWTLITSYSLAALVYAIAGAEAATGLPGYLITLELQLLGMASWKTAAFLTVICYMIPLALICKLVAILAPDQMDAFLKVSEAMRGKPPIYWMTWDFIFAVTGMVLLGTMVVGAVLYLQMQQAQRARVYEVDLDHGSARPEREARFVTLKGHLARKFTSAYRKGDDLHVIIPVTEATWTPANPVRYFIHHRTYGSASETALPEAIREPGEVILSGELGERLPVFVQQEYTAKGLKIDPSYSVVDWPDVPDQGLPAIENVYVVLSIGGMLTLATFLFMAMLRVRRQLGEKWNA